MRGVEVEQDMPGQRSLRERRYGADPARLCASSVQAVGSSRASGVYMSSRSVPGNAPRS